MFWSIWVPDGPQRSPDGPQRSRMVPTGPRWSPEVPDGPRWSPEVPSLNIYTFFFFHFCFVCYAVSIEILVKNDILNLKSAVLAENDVF